MLRWGPQEFWASNVWEVMEAWEGYARSKGIKPAFNPKDYPDEEGRKALREREERERLKNGDA